MNINLILYNSKIFTADKKNSWASALAVSGNKIIAIGNDSDVLKLANSKTETIDLQGRLVLPGFIDSHIHFLGFAERLNSVDLDGIDSLEKALSIIKEKVEQSKKGEWILGGGWNKNLWNLDSLQIDSNSQSAILNSQFSKSGFPTKEHLDSVSPDNPVALDSKDGHTLWVNSLALKLCNIDKNTKDVEGGKIIKDKNGEPTGILQENAIDLVSRVLKEIEISDAESLVKSAIKKAHQYGVTSIHNCEGNVALSTFQKLLQNDELNIRVFEMIPSKNLDYAIAIGLRTGFGNEKLRIGGIKIFTDGALGSQSADMIDDYEGKPGNKGISTISEEELTAMIQKAESKGFSVAVHAIGDNANRKTLNAIEKLQTANPKSQISNKLRHRIEHAQLLTEQDIPRFAKLNVIASMQPIHATSDMEIADKYWGKRARYGYAWNSLIKSGAVVTFGSDCPIETMEVLKGIYSAITRERENGFPEGGWYPEECISLEDAIRCYTINGAYSSYEENIKGSIEIGKLADLVVLSQNIFELSPKEILKTKVDYTIFDGKIFYISQGRKDAKA